MTIRRQHSGAAAGTTLQSSVGTGDTSFTVATGTGSSFPDGSVGPFVITLDGGTTSEERVLVTSRAGDVFSNVTRAYDNTTAKAHSTGGTNTVTHTFSAVEADEANAHVMASSGVHGVTDAVVGTTDTQTVTNKTISLGSNTVSGTTAQFNTALSDNDFATLAGSETLTNKTLTSPTVNTPTIATPTFSGAITDAAYTTYTPALANVTLGNGTVAGRYRAFGKRIHFTIQFTYGSTTTVSGQVGVGLPVNTAAAPAELCFDGHFNQSGGGARYAMKATLTPGSTMMSLWLPEAPSTGTNLLFAVYQNASLPQTSGNFFVISGTYESA